MTFYSGKVVRHPDMGNPTLLIITDRNDLDDQLFGTFAGCKDLLRQSPVQAGNRSHLKELLKVASGGIVFTTIQKFMPDERGDVHTLLSNRNNIVVIADEAHRSQYDFINGFARHLHDALPNASFIGFTAAPIESDDRSTPAVFGDYIDKYDILRAVEDGATVPIYYESRLARIELSEAQLAKIDPEFEQITEAEEESGKQKLKTKWAALEAMVGADYKLVKEIRKLLAKKYSPDAVIMHYKKLSWPTDTRISTRTLYRYIHEGLLGDARDCLLRGKRRHKKGSKGYKRHNRAQSAMKSISTRPDYIEKREEFGHWEIDSIVGAKGKGKQTLMTLLERSGRFIVIKKLPDGTSNSLVKTLDKLERKLGSRQFRKVFKSITCDNGSEFMDSQKMERSCLTRGKRSTIYYAHPYSSWERGSNENANGVVRRFIPKGSDIGCYSKKEIKEIQDWVNNYPRRILGGRSANEAIGIHLTA